MRHLLASLLLLSSTVVSATPTAPTLIVNQVGRLLGSDDRPVAGPVKLRFELHTLFASGAGDETVWTDEYAAIPVDSGGAYAVPLGDTSFDDGTHQPLTPDLFAGDRWLAVSVNDVPMTPWLRVGMVPVAAHALDAMTLGGQSMTDLDAHFDAKYAPLAGLDGYAELSPGSPQTGALAVTGNVTAQAFVGDGAELQNLDAGNISAGTLAAARLPAEAVLLSSSPVFTGAAGVTAPSFSGDGAALTGLNAANVSSGTLAAARLPADTALLDATAQTFTGSTTLLDAHGTFAGDGAGLTNLDLSAVKADSVLALDHGGTGATSIAAAQTALNVPSRSGDGASGTWGIDISGNASTATALSASGTACPAGQASGGVDASGNAVGCFTPGGGVPTGAVMFFNLATCPTGWTALTQANGRYLVGMPAGGTLAAAVGTALTDQENRPTGNHFHQIMSGNGALPIGLTAVNPPFLIAGDARQPTLSNYSNLDMVVPSKDISGNSISGSGTSATGSTLPAGTNAPYLQLLVCQKD